MKLRFPQTVFASLTAVALAAAAVLAGGQAIAAKPTATPTPKSSNAANKADSASSKSAETDTFLPACRKVAECFSKCSPAS